MSKSRQSNGRERDELMRDLSAPIETGKRRSRQRPAQVFPADRARAPRQAQQGKRRQEQNRRDPDDSLLDRRQIATEQRAPGKAAAESAPTRSQLFPADYAPRPQFTPFHARTERFACIVTHRRAGKTVACIHDLQRAALSTSTVRPRLAYLSPFLKQSKAVA